MNETRGKMQEGISKRQAVFTIEGILEEVILTAGGITCTLTSRTSRVIVLVRIC